MYFLNLFAFFTIYMWESACGCVRARPRAQRSMPRTCVQIYPIIVYIFIETRTCTAQHTNTQHIQMQHTLTHLQLAIQPCKNVRLHIFMASLPFYNSNDIVFFLLIAFFCSFRFYFVWFQFFLHLLSICFLNGIQHTFFYCSRHDKAHEKWCGEQQHIKTKVCA